jgi:hypothetical protein
MTLSINLETTHPAIIANSIGDRSLSLRNSLIDSGIISDAGIIKKIWNLFRGIAGFLWVVALEVSGWAGFSPTDLVEAITQKANELWCFNWMATDAEIGVSIAARNQQLVQVWQTFVAESAVSLIPTAVGFGASLLVPVIRASRLAQFLKKQATDEAVDTIKQQFLQALATSADRVATNALAYGYMRVRRAIRSYARSSLNQGQNGYLGTQILEFLEDWGTRPGLHWSFADVFGGTCKQVLPSPNQPQLPPGKDWDDYIEPGVIIRVDVNCCCDDSKDNELKKLEITPNTENTNEKLIVYGNKKELPTQIIQTLNTYNLLASRESVCGDCEDTETPRHPPNLRELKIVFYTVSQPPLNRGKRHTLRINNPRADLTWSEIKSICSGLSTGSHYAVSRLIETRHKMMIHGRTQEEAEANLVRVAALSGGTLGNINPGRITTEANDDAVEAAEIYPIYLEASIKIPDSNGNLYQDGNRYRRYGERVTLWYDNSPIGSGSIYEWLASRDGN